MCSAHTVMTVSKCSENPYAVYRVSRSTHNTTVGPTGNAQCDIRARGSNITRHLCGVADNMQMAYNIAFRSFCSTADGWIHLKGDIEAPQTGGFSLRPLKCWGTMMRW